MSPEHQYALPPGFRLRQYRIVRLLGHGGFGLTYLADDTNLQRKVAIKEMLPIDFAVRERDGTTVVARSDQDKTNLEWARRSFVEEGRTLAALQHPSILHVYDIFELHGTAYLVTAFIEGSNLEQWLRRHGALREDDILSLLSSLLDALQLVHERGFLHRDIKPENILMDETRWRPVLIDFGNARMATGEKTLTMTAVLTRGYAPFEQYQTKGRQGPFSDLYALGAVVYRSITGSPPADALDRLDGDKVQVLSQQRIPGFSPEFLATIDKALKMNRADRWQKCEEWKAGLGVANPPPRRSPGRPTEPSGGGAGGGKERGEPPERTPSSHVSEGGEPALSGQTILSGDLVACAECGRGFPKSETTQIEGSNVCGECKSAFMEKVRKEIAADTPPGIWRSGRQLVTSLNATLPPRCVKCNAPAVGKPVKRKLYCFHPAFYLVLLLPGLGIIIYVVTALMTRKTGVAWVSICRRHRFARRTAIIVSSLLALVGLPAGLAGLDRYMDPLELLCEVAFWGGLILCIVSPRKPVAIFSLILALVGVAGHVDQASHGSEMIVFLGHLAFLGGITYGIVSRRLVVARKIDKEHMWLGGCRPEFLAGFPEWNGPN